MDAISISFFFFYHLMVNKVVYNTMYFWNTEHYWQVDSGEEAGCFIEVPPLSHEVSVGLVREWLRQSGRDLSKQQLEIVNKALQHCSLPLYTSLVFEEVSTSSLVYWLYYTLVYDLPTWTVSLCLAVNSALLSTIGSRALALADPYCQSVWNSVCLCVCLFVCLSATLRSNISETKGARRKVTIGSL